MQKGSFPHMILLYHNPKENTIEYKFFFSKKQPKKKNRF